jgi:hypothetical protein
VPILLGPLLSASAVRHSEERQRVEGVLIRAADAEFDVPRESGRSYTRIECCRREASERREHIDAVVVRDQYQRIVPERHVMPTVDEDVERKLSRRLWIDYQVPRAGDSGRVINWFAVTVERAASKRAIVRPCALGLRWTRQGHEDQQDHGSQDYRHTRQMNVSIFHNMISFVCFHVFISFHYSSPEIAERGFRKNFLSCASEPFAHGLPCGKRVRWSSLWRDA